MKGAQTNFSFDKAVAYGNRKRTPTAVARRNFLSLFTVPWLPTMQKALEALPLEEISAVHDSIPAGVFARSRSSPYYPPGVPDLIGVKDRRYFDRTGETEHRSLGDLLRYASMAQGIEFLSSFGGFIPNGEEEFTKLPPPASQERFSDPQLYALGLYLYSLKPPTNPNRLDAAAGAGRKVFQRSGCNGCHPPPVYTNNKLLPVAGFQIPQDHRGRFDILDTPIDTDPRLTLQTRRGTGYYKVPSLRGLWYRGPFEHDGSVAPWKTGSMSAGSRMTTCRLDSLAMALQQEPFPATSLAFIRRVAPVKVRR